MILTSQSYNYSMLNEQGKSLLIVEDDQDIRDSLKLILEQEGYEVSVAENGAEALKLLPHIPKPSLILLDLMMPHMNGSEFAATIAEDDMYATIPVVVLTASKDPAHIDRSKEVLRKPIEITKLLALIKHHFFRGLFSETENSEY